MNVVIWKATGSVGCRGALFNVQPPGASISRNIFYGQFACLNPVSSNGQTCRISFPVIPQIKWMCWSKNEWMHWSKKLQAVLAAEGHCSSFDQQEHRSVATFFTVSFPVSMGQFSCPISPFSFLIKENECIGLKKNECDVPKGTVTGNLVCQGALFFNDQEEHRSVAAFFTVSFPVWSGSFLVSFPVSMGQFSCPISHFSSPVLLNRVIWKAVGNLSAERHCSTFDQ